MPIRKLQFAVVVLVQGMVAGALADAPRAVPVDGPPFHGELIAAGSDWRLTFRLPHEQRSLSAADLVSWGQCEEQRKGGCLVLSDSSLLAADVTAADKDTVSVDSSTFGKLRLPRRSVSGMAFRLPAGRSDRDRLLDRLRSPLSTNLRSVPGEGQGVRAVRPAASRDGPGATTAKPSDQLILDNGDELIGSLTAIAGNLVTFQTDVGAMPVKAERITAIALDSAGKTQEPPPVGLRAWLGFRDGSRLLATNLLVAGQSLKLTASAQTFSASSSSLSFLQPLGGRAVYLSDITPTEYHQTPFLDLSSGHAPRALRGPYQNDRNVTGELLRCGGRLYLKGLGVHSAARLVYELSPLRAPTEGWSGEGQGVRANSLTRFDAELGIDDSTAGQGSVEFRVLVDGQERYHSPTVRGGQPPLPISVDVSGGKQLELIVDYADKADVQDHADWLNARLICPRIQ